jgi:hypothetical protein
MGPGADSHCTMSLCKSVSRCKKMFPKIASLNHGGKYRQMANSVIEECFGVTSADGKTLFILLKNCELSIW